ncbi:hypothetical protein ACQP3L_33795, partial [Escherichia coli]
ERQRKYRGEGKGGKMGKGERKREENWGGWEDNKIQDQRLRAAPRETVEGRQRNSIKNMFLEELLT